MHFFSPTNPHMEASQLSACHCALRVVGHNVLLNTVNFAHKKLTLSHIKYHNLLQKIKAILYLPLVASVHAVACKCHARMQLSTECDLAT